MKLLSILFVFSFLYTTNLYAQFDTEGSKVILNEKYKSVELGSVKEPSPIEAKLTIVTSNNPVVPKSSKGIAALQTIIDSGSEYGIISNVSDNEDKAFVVMTKASLKDEKTKETFVVKGDGMVYATEIKVQLPPFPDYVFEPDYPLMSIQELKQYINKEGHLPNVPSAKEVKENGIGLGELSIINTEKIEELTQYIILLQEEITNLQQKFNLLLEEK